jgi:ankyrin
MNNQSRWNHLRCSVAAEDLDCSWLDVFTDDELVLDAIRCGHIAVDEEREDWITPLLDALRLGRVALASELLRLGAYPNAISDTGETTMGLSIPDLDFEIIQRLCQAGADIEQTIDYFWTPLHYACRFGRADVAEYLLKRGASMEALGERGETPLIEAVWHGQQNTVELLLRYGANRSASSAVGNSALDVAVRRGWSTIAAIL